MYRKMIIATFCSHVDASRTYMPGDNPSLVEQCATSIQTPFYAHAAVNMYKNKSRRI